MKYILILTWAVIASCAPEPKDLPVIISSREKDSIRISELEMEMAFIIQQNYETNDSLVTLKKINDSLSSELFINRYKVEKVRFYLALCKRDRTQDKFLKGWVTRAVE